VVLRQAGNHKNAQTVIFGSQATMEFFASVPDLKDYRERLKQEVRPRMPASYQVIVRCGVDRVRHSIGTMKLTGSSAFHLDLSAMN